MDLWIIILHTNKERFPNAPENAFAHLYVGTNMAYVDPEHNLVVVTQWIESSALDGLVARVLESIEK